MDTAIEDEITSINSIYGDGTLQEESNDPTVCLLRLPSLASVVLRCEFPNNYPDVPPSILGTETVGSSAHRGLGKNVVDLSRRILAEIYTPGESCVFDLLEELGKAVEQDETIDVKSHSEEDGGDGRVSNDDTVSDEKGIDLSITPSWALSSPLIEKKSVFVARAARISSPDQARQFLNHLLATDKKVANATHNITAWRIHGLNGVSYQDCDDDGETAAGGRVLHLMQLMDVWDVIVVVTRWYGGILLGPDRFRIINAAAREALVAGGFAADAAALSKGKVKK